MQQAEVQTVTFSAGLGLGGSATLTYTDLYGQSWTTRPINLGDGLHYVLDYALGTTTANVPDTGYTSLSLSYGGVAVTCGDSHSANSAGLIREKLLGLSTIGDATDLAKSIRVTKRPDRTSHKFVGGIEADAKTTYDIFINPDHLTGFNEAGGLKEFTASIVKGADDSASTMVADGKAYVNLRLVSDASADIKDALEGLPNNVIPAVTVTKADYTTRSTSDLGTYGNVFHQSYSITFSSSTNTGDQNMLSCDATPCDDDGCINRKTGAASIMYMHHDYTFGATSPSGTGSGATTLKVPKANFQGQGYFIMDIHRATQTTSIAGDFSSGNAYVEWNTGAGVERAEFPIIGTAATVQTALRGITGWSGVTVSSQCQGTSPCTTLSKAHSYTVTFASGYDDGGQTPNVDLVTGYGGGAGLATDGDIIIYDQRFSNSLWLGDITGWEPVLCRKTATDPVTSDYCNAGGVADNSDSTIQGEYGSNFKMSIVNFGHENQFQASTASIFSNAKVATFMNVHSDLSNVNADFGLGEGKLTIDNTKAYIMVDNTKPFPTATSQNTEEHFAVGSTIEVLPKTWDRSDRDADIPTTGNVDNAYRSFRVLSHVSNVHGQTFAKLDSTPTTASGANYALKVISHNSTVTKRTGITLNAAQAEVQNILTIKDNKQATHADDQYRIYINAGKPNVEFTEILTGDSTPDQIKEAINSFSALSGPVTVVRAAAADKIKVTFSDIDGDVPQLTVEKLVDGDTGAMSTEVLKEGWSFFAGNSARLQNVAPGSVINITSRETVEFSIGGTWNAGNLVASYDGNVGSVTMANNGAADGVANMINSIRNGNGAGTRAKFAIDKDTDVLSHGADKIKIIMPLGVDASKLELIPDASFNGASITKTVAKNNNGKSFNVLRVMNQKFSLASPTSSDATTITHTVDNNGPFVVGDEIEAIQGTLKTKCAYIEDAVPAVIYKEFMPITAVGGTDGTSTVLTITPDVSDKDATGCSMAVYRTTLVVDSKPDALSGSVDMTIYGAKGSCSVEETVKGTYESDVCSSRGSCDGGSGLCTCHEGYSGEACETQTVLV